MEKKSSKNAQNGAMSAYFTIFLMQPLQVIRTSMIVLDHNGRTPGIISTAINIYKQEKIYGFYRGFLPALIKTTYGSAVYFGCLELFKKEVNILKRTNKFQINDHFINFCSSATARLVQAIATNPIIVIKTRQEVIGFHAYSNILHGFISLWKDEGLKGLFRGLKPSIVKDVPFSGVYYSLYEFCKTLYKTIGIQNVQLQASASALTANFILITITNPLEVIRTRLQYLHFSHKESHNYKGIIHGCRTIFANEGIRGLMAGVSARFIKRGLSSVLVWSMYETLKHKH